MPTLYGKVPKGLEDNLQFRRELVRYGSASEHRAQELRRACAADLLFWVNAFGYTYDPRRKGGALPFLTYPFQDDALRRIEAAIDGQHDLFIEKSRDMGASWLCLLVFLHRWTFQELQSFLLLSRKEEFVDEPADPKALFQKMDFYQSRMPKWLVPEHKRQYKLLHNLENGSTINGESTNENAGRGDRRTAMLLDEFAAVENGRDVLAASADTTDCRIFNTTPKGTACAAYVQRELTPPENILRLHWTQHPRKAEGLWRDSEGKLHSDWYDQQVRRRTSAAEVAQELDINWLGSNVSFFEPAQIEEVKRRDVRPPVLTGELDYERHSLRPLGFQARSGGAWLLWCQLPGGNPPPGPYVIGIDVSTGTGASNSCFAVAHARTGEKVAEYCHSKVRPEGLAALAFAAGTWFHDAYLIWDAYGPGTPFGKKLIDLGYRNLYYRTEEFTLSKKTSDSPGFYSTPANKTNLLVEYRQALGQTYLNRSVKAVEECLEFVYLVGSDAVEHQKAVSQDDPSGARSNHGDRVIADALCWKGLKERYRTGKVLDVSDTPPEIPAGCLAWRRQRHQELELAEASW